MKRLLCGFLAVLLLLSLAGCGEEPARERTLRAAVTKAAANWSPHAWTTQEEGQLAALLTVPLCQPVPKDTRTGEYQWAFLAAEGVKDVTRDHPGGGSVYEITLRQGLTWEDGTSINADTYLSSMDALLATAADNPRAERFRTGSAALARSGLTKEDDHTLLYACRGECSRYDLLTALSESFLVHPGLHEKAGENYGTGMETTLSCGPYRLESRTESQLVLVRNPSYWEYQKNSDGSLSSVSLFEVDGAQQPQYAVHRIRIDVMSEEAAAKAYQEGGLDLWYPGENADAGMPGLYRKDQTFTLRLFFHTNSAALTALDRSGATENARVLESDAFRKALSLSIDRESWVTATPGYRPALTLVNGLYYYDVKEDPASIFRNSEPAMTELCALYGAAPEGDLQEASRAITGFDKEAAKALFVQALAELAEVYTPGDPIRLQIAWKSGALTEADNRQIKLLETYWNEALAGTGFGPLTLEGAGGLENRYAAVADGKYALGMGAWGGFVFRPFAVLRQYCDPSYADPLHESGCWDPAEETVTLTVAGQEVTQTWQAWSVSLPEGGAYENLPVEEKVAVFARLERLFLEKYYAIPLASTAECLVLSPDFRFCTEQYHVLYGFGGLRLLTVSPEA